MEQKVSIYSDGLKIAGVLYEPEDAGNGSCPGVVLCQGMAGVKEYFWLPHIGRRLADLGYVALIWDYRGVGESEGDSARLFPLEQAEDIRNALSYLQVQAKVDPERLALMGWSYGGGMVPYVAGVDERVKCSISVVGWGNGEGWMRSVRRHYEWLEFSDRLGRDRKSRVITGVSEFIDPKEIITPDPATDESRKRAISKIPEMENFKRSPYYVSTVQKLIEFKPIEVVDRISPRAILYIVAEKDTVTPADNVIDMYERTREPKKLWVIPDIQHYDVYSEPFSEQVFEMATDWLKEHLGAQ